MAASLGFTRPGTADLFALGIAAGIAAGTILVAWLAGRWAVPRIADFWERKAGARAEGLVPRACALVHGDLAALQWFQKELAEQRPGMKVILPPSGETITI